MSKKDIINNDIISNMDHPLYDLIFSVDVEGFRNYLSKMDVKKGFTLKKLAKESKYDMYDMPWLNIVSEYSHLPNIDDILFLALFIKHKFHKNEFLIKEKMRNVFLSIESSRLKNNFIKNMVEDLFIQKKYGRGIYSKVTNLYLTKYEYQLNQIIIILLKQGAKVSSTNQLGETPLITAAIAGDVKAVEILLAGGSNTNGVLDYIDKKEEEDEIRWKRSRGLMEDDEDVKDEQFQYYDDELSISNRIVYNEAKGFEKIRKMIKKSIRYDLNELEYEEEYEIDRLNKEIKDILSILTKEEQKEVEYNIKYMFIDISKSSFEDLKQYYEDLERINYSLERRLMVKKGTKILTFRLKSKKSNRK